MTSFHGKVSPMYLAKAETLFLPLKKLSYQKMRISPHDHVLDVGCGPGIDVVNLAQRVGLNGRVVGLDRDLNMLKEAFAAISQKRLIKNVSLIQGRADALPFPDNHFDGVRSERLFMHLERPRHVLKEMVRVTKPGGRIVVIDTDWCSLSIDNPFPKVETALVNYRLERVLKNGYSGRSLYRLFREQALVDIEVDVFPVCLTDIELFYFITMQSSIEDQALADFVVTEQELDDWRSALNQAAQNDCFFSSASAVMISASKP